MFEITTKFIFKNESFPAMSSSVLINIFREKTSNIQKG